MFRPLRPFAQNSPLNASQIEVLAQANQLIGSGKPGDAAPLFAQLAQDLSSNHPRRAANLHALAAHAYADSAHGQLALGEARAALTIFLQANMMGRAPVFYNNILRKFTQHGMKNAADALQSEFGGKVGSLPAQGTPGPKVQRGLLPTNCPKCGAPVRGDSATWINDQTAECEYCGSAVRTVS